MVGGIGCESGQGGVVSEIMWAGWEGEKTIHRIIIVQFLLIIKILCLDSFF